MRKIFALFAVLFLFVAVYAADSTIVVDTVIPQKTIVIAEHVEYPVWRFTGDSLIKRNDIIAIRFLHRRQGGAVVKDFTMKWTPREASVTGDSLKTFLKFNTTK
jgi:hypothetical protein